MKALCFLQVGLPGSSLLIHVLEDIAATDVLNTGQQSIIVVHSVLSIAGD